MVCLSHFGKSPAKSLTLEMGLPSPLTPSTWTEPFLHTQLQKERKSKQLPYPRICCQSQQRRGRRLEGHQTEAAAEGQTSGTRVCGPDEDGTVPSGQVPSAHPFQSWVAARVHASPSSAARPFQLCPSLKLLVRMEPKPAPLPPALPFLKASCRG